LLTWLPIAWKWLGDNKDPLGVVLAAIGVAVAAGYVVLTFRLANAAREQARLTEDIARETRHQAEIGRQAFEAGHRPYMELVPEDANFGGDPQKQYALVYSIENHGSVPAIDLRWTIVVRLGAEILIQRESEVARILFPGKDRNVRITGTGAFAVEDPPRGLLLEARVDYRGASGRDYFTVVHHEAEPPAPFWRLTHHELA